MHARRARRSNACRCCAGASLRRTACRPRTSSRRPTPPGCCKATAASPMRTRSRPVRAWSKANGGSPTIRGRRWSRSRSASPTASASSSATRSTVNVLGRNITARVANLRTVDWQSLGINFVMVFSPTSFRGAPHTHIATLTYPGGSTTEQETALLKAVADAFPTVTTVRVREALDAVGSVVTNLVLGDPRRQRAHAAGRRAGARRRAGGRPPPSRL